MRRLVIASVVVSFVLCGASCAAPTASEGESIGEPLRAPDTEEAAFLSLINDYRASQGLGALAATPLLNQVAYDHSLDMATNAYFDHNDQQGHSPFDRMAAAGYHGGYMAENIAAGNDTAAATFAQWKGSAGHNANMLGTHYKAIGIGRAYVKGSPYGWYWTTDFGDVIDSSVNTGGTSDAGTVDSGVVDSGVVDTGSDAGVDASPVTPPSGCSGASEKEPNDAYTAPNALDASLCGSIGSATDQDWYTFTLATGVHYDVALAASGDAQLVGWKLVKGQYGQLRNTSVTEITGTSSGAGTYLVRVSSPSGATQSYTIRR